MTLDERIEAAAKRLHGRRNAPHFDWDGSHPDMKAQWIKAARGALADLLPELFTSPPTLVLMPMEWPAGLSPSDADASMYWRTWRDAYLNREGK